MHFAGSIPDEWSAKVNGTSGFYGIDVSDNPCICGALPAWWQSMLPAYSYLTASKLREAQEGSAEHKSQSYADNSILLLVMQCRHATHAAFSE